MHLGMWIRYVIIDIDFFAKVYQKLDGLYIYMIIIQGYIYKWELDRAVDGWVLWTIAL